MSSICFSSVEIKLTLVQTKDMKKLKTIGPKSWRSGKKV